MPHNNPPALQPHGLRDLRAFQLAKQLAHLAYDATASFPKDEYRLCGQIRGAAISNFGNIAEGDDSWDCSYGAIKEDLEDYDA